MLVLILVFILLLPNVAVADAAEAGENLLANGGFEQGAEKWLYHQWTGKAVPGRVDRGDAFEGNASFKFTTPGDTAGRYMAHEVAIAQPDRDHVLSFALKTKDLPEGAGRVRLAIDGRGFLGSETGKVDLVKLGGTQDWTEYSFPVPAASLGGTKKVTVFIYHDQPSKGVLGIDAVSLRVGSAAPTTAGEPTLIGDTSDPELSTFILGRPAELTFAAGGLEPGQSATLELRFLDEHDAVLATKSIPVEVDPHGAWQTKLTDFPHDRLGFYRVEAELSGVALSGGEGVKLAKLGTRPAGYLTYAVVPDPAERKDFGETGSRFGMQGGFGPWGNRSLALLGARWVLDGNFEWRRNEPERAGQFAEAMAKAPGKWGPVSPRERNTYALPTLFAAPKWATVPETFSYMTGALKPEHEAAWQDYCRQAVKAFMQKYPDREHRVYQVTWEPMPPWGFKGSLAELVRVYELAYPAIKEADPGAIVAGPTLGLQHREDMQVTQDVFAMGLAEHLDGYTCHPYFSMTPEKDGMIDRMRALKRILAKTAAEAGKAPLPMYGTEQGQSTKEKRSEELKHARALIRQNLITLGEGFAFNMGFYIVDYHLAGQTGYGYYYNLVDGVPWGPAKAGPRPIVPAYAAQSFLLDGADAVRAIDWLGGTAWGYAFERASDGVVVLALWDYGDEARTVRLPVGVERVELHDWMGRATAVAADDQRSVELTLGPEPVYVVGVSPRLWGKAGVQTLAVAAEESTASPDEEVELAIDLAAPADGALAGEVVVEAAALGLDRQAMSVSLQPGERATLPVKLAVPAGAEPGEYALRLSVVDAGRPVALAGHRLRVVPPVTVEAVRPIVGPGDATRLAVSLRDRRGQGQRGELTLAVPGLLDKPASLRFDLPAGEADTLIATLAGAEPHPFRIYPIELTTDTGGGQRFTQTRHANWYAPPHVASPPRIDGRLDDWGAIEPINVPDHAPGSSKASDLAAAVRMGWDAEAFYIAVDVTDDTFFQRWNSHNTWRGDALTLTFNLDPEVSNVASGNELADAAKRPRRSKLNVALTPDDGVQTYRHATPVDGEIATGEVPADEVVAAAVQRPGGMTYELAIRWRSLGAEAAPGPDEPFRLALSIMDRDSDEPAPLATVQVFRGSEGAGDAGLLRLAPPSAAVR